MTAKIRQPHRNSLFRRRKSRVYLRNGDILVPATHRRVVPARNRNDEDWPLFGSQIRHTIKVIRQTVKNYKADKERKQRIAKPAGK